MFIQINGMQKDRSIITDVKNITIQVWDGNDEVYGSYDPSYLIYTNGIKMEIGKDTYDQLVALIEEDNKFRLIPA